MHTRGYLYICIYIYIIYIYSFKTNQLPTNKTFTLMIDKRLVTSTQTYFMPVTFTQGILGALGRRFLLRSCNVHCKTCLLLYEVVTNANERVKAANSMFLHRDGASFTLTILQHIPFYSIGRNINLVAYMGSMSWYST